MLNLLLNTSCSIAETCFFASCAVLPVRSSIVTYCCLFFYISVIYLDNCFLSPIIIAHWLNSCSYSCILACYYCLRTAEFQSGSRWRPGQSDSLHWVPYHIGHSKPTSHATCLHQWQVWRVEWIRVERGEWAGMTISLLAILCVDTSYSGDLKRPQWSWINRYVHRYIYIYIDR